MKRYFLLAVGIAVICLAFFTQPVKAQIYTEFLEVTLTQQSYTEIDFTWPDFDVLEREDFGLPPNFEPDDFRNGYYKHPIEIPWGIFTFNGESYNAFYVNVNGFITFTHTENNEKPPFVSPDDPNGLFTESTSFPTNVAAPFWGDHYYRWTPDTHEGYVQSEISTATHWNGEVMCVQWKNLNINFREGDSVDLKNSIGNFQIWIYKSEVVFSDQGDIEFAYGQIGGNPDAIINTIITRGCAVGMKGDGQDFINGLYFDGDPVDQRTMTTLTNEWTPSGGTDWRILFTAKPINREGLWWGDGDSDMSKARGNKHNGMPQNRFVTINDARNIMRSVATGIPLDSVHSKEAFHGDVTHNGRFYYDNSVPQVRIDIPWRNEEYTEDLPDGITSGKRVLFQVTSLDAAYILHYIAARIPSLPWMYDTIVRYGKVGMDDYRANGLKFGDAVSLGGNEYRMPVYLEGTELQPIGGKFELNAQVTSVSGNEVLLANHDNRVVFAGSGNYDFSTPAFFVNFVSDMAELNISNVRVNDEDLDGFSSELTEVENGSDLDSRLSNWPNPFTTSTVIKVEIADEGNYDLNVFDVHGKLVKSLNSSMLTAGPHDFVWDGTDNNGNVVESGVYVYKLSGDTMTLTNKLVLSK